MKNKKRAMKKKGIKKKGNWKLFLIIGIILILILLVLGFFYVYQNKNKNKGVEKEIMNKGELGSAGVLSGEGSLNNLNFKTGIGLYDPLKSEFHLKNNFSGGNADLRLGFGWKNESFAINGDWDGDGIDSVGLYDQITSTFYLKNNNSNGNSDYIFQFGNPFLESISGDWDNDGKDGIGLYDRVSSTFYLKNILISGNPDITVTIKNESIYCIFNGPVCEYRVFAGDFNGDSKDEIGWYDPINSLFYIKNDFTNKNADIIIKFGETLNEWKQTSGSDWPGLFPVTGDFDNDGKDGIGLYDPYASEFRLKNNIYNNNEQPIKFIYGQSPSYGYYPLAGRWKNSDEGCISSLDLDCPSDSNPCTTESCVNGKCVSTNNNLGCNDNIACTQNDICSNGICSGNIINCNDNITCTIDSCQTGTCIHDTSNCSCTNNTQCNDNNICTDNSCLNTSCISAFNNNSCNDNNNNTINDKCVEGNCVGIVINYPYSGNTGNNYGNNNIGNVNNNPGTNIGMNQTNINNTGIKANKSKASVKGIEEPSRNDYIRYLIIGILVLIILVIVVFFIIRMIVNR